MLECKKYTCVPVFCSFPFDSGFQASVSSCKRVRIAFKQLLNRLQSPLSDWIKSFDRKIRQLKEV